MRSNGELRQAGEGVAPAKAQPMVDDGGTTPAQRMDA